MRRTLMRKKRRMKGMKTMLKRTMRGRQWCQKKTSHAQKHSCSQETRGGCCCRRGRRVYHQYEHQIDASVITFARTEESCDQKTSRIHHRESGHGSRTSRSGWRGGG